LIRISAAALLLYVVVQATAVEYRIETFAGSDFNGDGRSALSALLVQPQAVAFDQAGNVYISDSGDHRVRKITPDGTIHTIAGTGIAGYRGDGGPAAKAQLNSPYGLALDWAGNVFVADLGNAVVRRISPDGNIVTVAGGGEAAIETGTPGDARLAKLIQPRDLAVDPVGNLYISDFGGHRIYQLHPDGTLRVLAGTGSPGVPMEYGLATQSSLAYPAGILIDSNRNLYVADSGNRRVRCLRAGIVTTLLDKEGKQVEFGVPTSIAMDAIGTVYVADSGATITAVAPGGDLERILLPADSVSVNVYGEIYAIFERQLTRYSAGMQEVVAGLKFVTAAGDGRPKPEWRFNSPSALAKDSDGNIYIADTGNGRVRHISPSGMLSTVTTQVAAPVALAFDSQGRLHIADKETGGIYRMESGRVELLAEGSGNRPMQPAAIAFDSQDQLFIADQGNNLIRRLDTDGLPVIVAGGGSETGDGPALRVRVPAPSGLAVDANDDVWFTEADTGKLRKLSKAGRIETIGGTELKQPGAVRLDREGNFVVTDMGAHRIVRIPREGPWEPLAGSGDEGFSGDGANALTAMLDTPADVLLQEDGSILFADSGNNRIRSLVPEALTPPPVTLPSLVVKHAGTGKVEAVAPGQLVFVSAAGTSIEAAEVAFGGLKGAVLSRGADLLTVRIPSEVEPGRIQVQASTPQALLGSADVEIVASAPAILTTDGSGQAAVLNENGHPNSVQNPALRGSVVAIYLTGVPADLTLLGANVGSNAAEVVWAGPAPGFPGLFQINVRTPAGSAIPGVQPLAVTIDGVQTQAGVTIATK
jgi:uncharacterized protein (TIGR03437 family)